MRSLAVLAVIVFLITIAIPVQSAIFYVRTDGNDANPGTSWALAKQTVQAGLDAASAGDEVWVAAGTYVQRITLKNGVALYGGFTGSETLREERDFTTNKTILDGNQGGSVVTSPQGATIATRIDGFVIRNGKATNGGGINSTQASTTIANNIITDNTGGSGSAVYSSSEPCLISRNIISRNYAGSISGTNGAIYSAYNSTVIENNIITGNIVTPPYSVMNACVGGISCYGSSGTITNNIISDNKGVGISCSSNSTTTISNNIITGNSGRQGGGISCYNSTLDLTNNTITGNHAYEGGGGIYFYNTFSPSVSNNIVAFNFPGIYSTGSTPVLRNNCVYGNGSYDYLGLSAGTGDISADPLLAAREYRNIHIQPNSPCVDAGWTEAPGIAALDTDGQPRIGNGVVDIGADESDGTAWPVGANIVVRVSASGDDANDGSSWALAKKTVQAAVDAASVLGGEVWVRSDTYYERVTLSAYTHMYGGFSGTENSRSERNFVANKTVLDGARGGSVVTSTAGYLVSTIDGFVIQNGSASDGGGIFCSYAAPMIANNTIVSNSATDRGGGVFCNYASPVITNSTLTGNTASHGGGINCYYSPTYPGYGDNTFVRPLITNNIITMNGARFGGGIQCGNTSPIITSNTITANSGMGGGVSCHYSSAEIFNNIMAFNSSGIYSTGSTPSLNSNCVYGNTSYDYSGLSAGTGDISVDPLLAGWEFGNIHIQPNSPCINAGWNDAAGLTTTDIDGQPRILEGTVDIGADESDGSSWPTGPNIVVRVSPDGDDAKDGSAWTQAKRTVQAAIDAASSLGGEVWVKAGTYHERITLAPYAHLYGGFSGVEDSRQQRHWLQNKTILDGEGGGSVVVGAVGFLSSTIDGFTIRQGSANQGGGIFCDKSSPEIRNNIITGNRASSGGAVYCRYSSAVISNNIIVGNGATNAGGIYCGVMDPIITNNTIAGNSSQTGGGVHCVQTSPRIFNNIIAFNGSGIFNDTGSGTVFLRNNCVYGNLRYDYSGLSAGTGDISVDPLLAGREYGKVHIQPNSPCINAGWNDAPSMSSTDIDGQSRIQDGTVDIGADESDGTTWSAGPNIVIRVRPDGDDASDGSTWSLAKKTVQAGIDTASKQGGEVWVSQGTYSERIILHPLAHVYAGFAGIECQKSQRNTANNKATLDGGAGGSVVTAVAGERVSTLDGFIVRNGSGTLRNSYTYGGGIYCDASSPTFSNNTIAENTARTGGGIYCASSAAPTIVDNSIAGNTASVSGGGMHIENSLATVAGNIISDNSASSGDGGGICGAVSSAAVITGNLIAKNRANGKGGGLYSVATSTITNNTVTENTASSGGGIYCGSANKIANNIVAFNSSGIFRGGIGALVLRNNCVFGNTSYDYSGLDAGTGDISADPLFVDRAAGNYHLSIASPCINAGWNDAEGLPETDMDGEPRICAGIVDIGADECWLKAASVGDAKATANGMMAEMSGSIVSAEFPNYFYIEAEDRSSGIRVEKAGHELEAGMTSFIAGAIGTNEDGEKFIAADTAVSDGAGSVAPLFLRNKTLGGGDSIGFSLATGSGQRGVYDGFGLNNIGLLITTTGWLTYSGPDYFYIDDGSALDDGSGHLGVKVLGPGPDPGEDGKCVRVTGVSSIRESGGNHIRAIESCVEDGVQVLK